MINEYRKVFVPEDFEKEVVLHVLKVFKFRHGTPLILAIGGDSGCGKTFQCKVVLNRLDVKVFTLSGSLFENKDAGEPSRLLRKKYDEAIEYCNENENGYAALVIDDADVAFGIWEGAFQYTVNTQHILGELMNIADPDSNYSSQRINRIPIILTGNDMKRIYGPVKRTGRMKFFPWEPTNEQIIDMVFNLYNNFSYRDTTKFVNQINEIAKNMGLKTPQISFYSHLKSYLIDDLLWKNYQISKCEIMDGSIISNINCKNDRDIEINIDSMIILATKLLNEIKKIDTNYLK